MFVVFFCSVLSCVELIDLRYIGGSGGMAKSSIPLPEICVEDFEHSWTKFCLAVVANKWEKEKEIGNPYRQVVVPIALRQTILEQQHNNAGHLGIHKKTFEKVKERLFCPEYEQDVKDAVK